MPTLLFHPHRESHHSLSLPTNSPVRDRLKLPRTPPKPVPHEIHSLPPFGRHIQTQSVGSPLPGMLRPANIPLFGPNADSVRSSNRFGISLMSPIRWVPHLRRSEERRVGKEWSTGG